MCTGPGASLPLLRNTDTIPNATNPLAMPPPKKCPCHPRLLRRAARENPERLVTNLRSVPDPAEPQPALSQEAREPEIRNS